MARPVPALLSAGGGPQRAAAAHALVGAGAAVMGHIGLTPQAISAMGGFRPQGRTEKEAVRLLREAHALQVAAAVAACAASGRAQQGAAQTGKACLLPGKGATAGPAADGQPLP